MHWKYCVLLSLLTLANDFVFGEAFPKSPVELHDIRPIEWLHIPNTGTSFGNILLRWGCNMTLPNVVRPKGGFFKNVDNWRECKSRFILRPYSRRNWPIGDHVPLLRRLSAERLHSVVTMLRGPSKRGNDALVRGKNVCEQMSARNQFALQTSYISGTRLHRLEGVRKGWQPSAVDGIRACMRVHYFAFVGITDLWQASVCLFHKKMGGLNTVQDIENVRPVKHGDSLQLENRGCPDDIDNMVFQCAIDRFLSEVSNSACSIFLQHVDLGSALANEKLSALLDDRL